MTHRNGSIFLDCLLLHIYIYIYDGYWLWLTAFLESFPQAYAKVLIMPKRQKVMYGSYKHNNENFEKSTHCCCPSYTVLYLYGNVFMIDVQGFICRFLMENFSSE